jgi:hypothetical protein
MAAYVTVPFRDYLTWREYQIGDEYEGDADRIAELAQLGFVGSESDADDAAEDVREAAEDEAAENPREYIVSMPALDTLTVAQLRNECKRLGIKYQRRATKDQLIALILGE